MNTVVLGDGIERLRRCDGNTLDLSSLGLSAALISRLDVWNRFFETVGVQKGFLPPELVRRWTQDGDELFEEVTRQLWTTANVVRRFDGLYA